LTPLDSERSRDDLLRTVSILDELPAQAKSRMISGAEPVQVVAGEWLFRQGDEADCLYIVASGRLEAVIEGPEPTVLRVLGRGSVIGELGLLTDSPRSASIRARRDSELLKIDRAQFVELLDSEPRFLRSLLGVLGAQLQVSRSIELEATPLPATVAVVPVREGLPAERLAAGLADQLGRWRSVGLLDSAAAGEDPAGFPSLLDRAEQEHEQVLLAASTPPGGGAWADFCLRQADLTLAVAEGLPGADLAWSSPLGKCNVLLLGRSPRTGTLASWLDALPAERGYLIGPGDENGTVPAAVARRLAGRSVGLVLSGGGARALAHIGVIEELLAAGIEIDRVGGASMGAIVGAQFAMGLSPAQMLDVCRREIVEGRLLSDYTIPLVALVRGERARRSGQRIWGSRLIEELQREFFSVSCDLVSSELVVHRRGIVYERVGASQALPGIFPPVTLDGRYLVDGGVLNNLPVEPMAATGEGPVVACDVGARFQVPPARREDGAAARARALIAGVGADVPFGVTDVMVRTLVLGSIDTAEAARKHADLVIEPEVSSIGLMAFDQLERARELGRQATRAALELSPEFAAEYATAA
jgi:NTE family protein